MLHDSEVTQVMAEPSKGLDADDAAPTLRLAHATDGDRQARCLGKVVAVLAGLLSGRLAPDEGARTLRVLPEDVDVWLGQLRYAAAAQRRPSGTVLRAVRGAR